MQDRRGSSYKSIYDFVETGKRESYINNGKSYSGYIDLEIVLCSYLHIGNGYWKMPEKGTMLVSETIKFDGKPIIPGSSFKGAVRAIAAAVSSSCSPFSQKCRVNDRCIVCDMFGMMGKASKVIFPDFCSDNAKTKVVELNKQFLARKEVRRSYKFYKTGENEYRMPDRIQVEVVDDNAVFYGKIFFKDLSEEQLALLAFSLGLNGNDDELINLKLGGYKNEGIGEVYTKVREFHAEGFDKKLSELAGQYSKMRSANKKAIADIQYILMGS